MRSPLIAQGSLLLLPLLTGCIALILPKLPDRCEEGSGPTCDGDFLVLCQNGVEISFDCGHQCRDANLAQQICLACGDGFVEEGEGCDDGNNEAGDGCDQACNSELCGDGTVNNNEECDDGNEAEGDGCSELCITEFCGDEIVNNTNEECDEGDEEPGDGCSELCIIEFCGDGIINNNDETCDDSNTTPGDGCDQNCFVECSNGTIDPGEECDDNNLNNGDGCDEGCQIEDLPGEVCNDGVNNDGDLFTDCQDEECFIDPGCACAAAQNIGTISSGGSLGANGDTTNREDVFFGSCTGGNAPEQIFVIIPAAAGNMTISLDAPANMGFYVRTTCDSAASQLVCQDSLGGGGLETTSLTVTAGTPLFIFVDGQGIDFGPFSLEFTLF